MTIQFTATLFRMVLSDIGIVSIDDGGCKTRSDMKNSPSRSDSIAFPDERSRAKLVSFEWQCRSHAEHRATGITDVSSRHHSILTYWVLGSPSHVTSKVLVHAKESPPHMQLPVVKVLETAIANGEGRLANHFT